MFKKLKSYFSNPFFSKRLSISRINIKLILLLLFLLFQTTVTFAQNEGAPAVVAVPVPNAGGAATPANAQEAPQPLILSIQYGKGGIVQEYTVQSGQAVFVPIGTPANPSQVMNVQDEKNTQAYQQQLSQISEHIASKINAIQRKQSEIDSEVYTVYRTPLGIEKQALQQDLTNLELRRDQLNSQIAARQGDKPVVKPQAPATSMSGLTVVASVKDGKTVLQVSLGKVQTTIKGPPDQWLQIFAAEKGKGQDIWAKVTPQVP